MPPGFRVSIGADPTEVARIGEAFDEFAAAQAVPDAVRRSVSVAIDELITNALSYGVPEKGGEISVAAELHPDRLTVTVSDNGVPFDPFAQATPDTTLPVEERPIGGVGIHLVRRLLDEVSYQRRGDRNIVVLTKRLDGGRAGSAGH